MKTVENTYVLIVAGGQGARFGAAQPKQYTDLCGKTVLRRSIESFLPFIPSDRIKVVIHPDHTDMYENSVQGLRLMPPANCGKERRDSVYNGLNALGKLDDQALVLIHDAARPLLHAEDLKACLHAIQEHRAICLAETSTGTQCYTSENGIIGRYIARDALWSLQTPQVFRFRDIMQAHSTANPDQICTDDTMLVSALGIPVKLVEAKYPNFKITHRKDLTLAEKILSTELSIERRTGLGFDVHAFDDGDNNSTGSVRLCGVDIPHDRKLKGHSDADVGLHALTDALLGAIGEGDIGLHFPPSNMDFKDMDSAIFLKHAVRLMQEKQGKLVNADVTLICERPKIGDYRDSLRLRVAQILGISPSRVNIKATTTEQLGFTGRREGIAAQAIVSVLLPATEG